MPPARLPRDDIGRILTDIVQRIERLERRLVATSTVTSEERAVFSFPGSVVSGGASPPWFPISARGASLPICRATLKSPDGSNDTVIGVYLFDDTGTLTHLTDVTIPAGAFLAIATVNISLGARQGIVVDVTTSGTPSDLTVLFGTH